MTIFKQKYKVRFEDCDYAGIVFYPRYILMLHRFFEDWFSDGLKLSLGTMHEHLKIGFPTVKLETQFKRASRLEDILDWTLQVQKIGSSSATLNIEVTCKKEIRLLIQIVVVCTALVEGGIQLQPIPQDIREKMKTYMV